MMIRRAEITSRRIRAFTLIELLTVIGIITILGALTVVSYRAIAKDAKMSSAKNAVMAMLDLGRGTAMKTSKPTLVVFRPRFDGPKSQYTEVVIAKWTGESIPPPQPPTSFTSTVDRFIPVPNIAPRALPSGIKVASPFYGNPNADLDLSWHTQTQLTAINQSTGAGEVAGEMLGVLFGADGTVIARNPQSDSNVIFVDFNNDERMKFGVQDLFGPPPATLPNLGTSAYFVQVYENDEPFIDIAPFLAVYDDDKARENRGLDWSVYMNYQKELTGFDFDNPGFITLYGQRIHFNRYTGVAMK